MLSKKDLSMKNKADGRTVYSVVFLIIMFLIFIGQLFVSDITVDTISEKYLWKEDLIEKYRKFKFDVGDNVFSYAVVGKEDWLFYTGEMSLRNYQKNDPLNISNIKKLTGIFNEIDVTVREYGGTFLVVIPPDKSTIYPQYMPNEIPVIGTTTSLDRLIERVEKYSDVRLLDLRPVLLQASDASEVYYKTDTHWNCLGAFYVYEEILSVLAEDFPYVKAYSAGDFDINSYESGNLDIAKMMEANVVDNVVSFTPRFDTSISLDTDYGRRYGVKSLRVVTNTNNIEQIDLMISHDSFYDACLNEFIKPTFGRTIAMPYTDVDLSVMLQVIEKEKPDIVIVEFAERLMDYFLWRMYE